ncbi:FixH family protein [Pedobacter nutrimenti]|uniref:YtkA-like protein n=1 Tax=Pedobacter nutrimenti TaxID=1241337 RepID=A0A318UFB5_9SPHI|nr:FixH family protein [Pedobacter nutrimenti]PYF70594.1 YtkA-like protein [Pedobacter nutrimenti]
MKKLYAFAFLLVIFAACKKDGNAVPDPKEGLQKISEAYAPGISTKVELWAKNGLSTGYNQLFVILYDSVSNQAVTKAVIKILPVMNMEMNGMHMSHSTPCVQPESDLAENTLFPFAAVFTMAGNTEQNKWSFEISIKRDGQTKTGIARLGIKVGPSSPERVKMLTTAEGDKLVVAYFFPISPKIGINELEIIVYRQQNLMSFVPAEDYLLASTPEMPAMGHGSPNNVDPAYAKNGGYRGKVNFTMTGDWRINLELTRSGQKITTFFDLSF